MTKRGCCFSLPWRASKCSVGHSEIFVGACVADEMAVVFGLLRREQSAEGRCKAMSCGSSLLCASFIM